MNTPVIVVLTPDEVARAQLWSDLVMRNLKPTPNYTGLSEPDRFFNGYKGELAVVRWLKFCGLTGVHHVNTSGDSQGSEIVMSDGRRVEVKTASQGWHKMMMLPEAQRLDFDYCVGARIDSNVRERIEIHGWEFKATVALTPTTQVRIPTRELPLKGLLDPGMLIELLRRPNGKAPHCPCGSRGFDSPTGRHPGDAS